MSILIVNCVEWGGEHKNLDCPYVGHWIRDAFGGDPGRFIYWDAQRDEEPPVGGFEGVIISGSAASVYDGHAWIDRLQEAIRDWAERQVPMLGICFGHQIIAHTFGGYVAKHPKGWEVGTQEVELTSEGKGDPLFSGIRGRLKVMESHQDAVLEAPAIAEVLAGNEHTGCQALRIGERIRSVQFHPEYTKERMEFLIGPRRVRLEGAGVDVDATLAGLESTPIAEQVLSNFERGFIQSTVGAHK